MGLVRPARARAVLSPQAIVSGCYKNSCLHRMGLTLWGREVRPVSAASWVGCFRFHGLLVPGGAGPVVVLHAGAVWDADRAARGQGVRPGQPAAAARTACPEAEVRRFDRAAAAPLLSAAWDLLAEAAPVVEPDPDGRPEACAAWGGQGPPWPEVSALQAAAARALPHVDLAVGLAGNRLTARVASPVEPGLASVAPGGEGRLLAPLPLSLLVAEGLLAPALLPRLRNLGLVCCGEVAALPEGALRERFGREGVRLRALCLGQDARPVLPQHPPRTLTARRVWPEGLPPEAWAAAAMELAGRAALGLHAAEGIRRLRLRGDCGEGARTWPAPCRTPGVLARAAGELAARLARQAGRAGGSAALEVSLEDLAGIAVRAVGLLPPLVGEGRAGQALDDLLQRLPRGALRRGVGAPDRHEQLLDLLDPWREQP